MVGEGHVHHLWSGATPVASKAIEGCHMAVTRGRPSAGAMPCRLYLEDAVEVGEAWRKFFTVKL